MFIEILMFKEELRMMNSSEVLITAITKEIKGIFTTVINNQITRIIATISNQIVKLTIHFNLFDINDFLRNKILS